MVEGNIGVDNQEISTNEIYYDASITQNLRTTGLAAFFFFLTVNPPITRPFSSPIDNVDSPAGWLSSWFSIAGERGLKLSKSRPVYPAIHSHFLSSAPFAHYLISIFTHLKLCLASATHNFKWVKITHVCLIWDITKWNPHVKTLFYFVKPSDWSANKVN